MKAFTTADLNKQVGAVTDAALKEPVFITHHKRPRFVLLTVDAYEKLVNQPGDQRRAYATNDLPADLHDGLMALVEEAERSDER